MKLSKAANNLEGQEMFKILAKTKELESQGKEILHFELGDPDFQTTENINEAVINSLDNYETHYAPSTGIKDLKETVSRHVSFNPSIDQILITAGANIQIYYALACLVNPGDDVIVPDPGFVSYYSILKFLGANAGL